MMRILIIHNKYQFQGGEDVVVESEGKLLATNGHTVEYLMFDNASIKSRLDKVKASIGMLYNRTSATLVRRTVRSFKPDIIHIHNIHFLASPAVFLVASRLGIPTVATLHNYRLICPSGILFFNGQIYERSLKSVFPLHSILKGVYRNSIAQTAAVAITMSLHNLAGTWRTSVDRYITLTDFSLQKFKYSSLRVPHEKFVVKPNFVLDCGDGRNEREDYFLVVGRLSPEKGISMLLEAASRHRFKLRVIGVGPLEPMVLEYARKDENINYLGHLNKEEIIGQMKGCLGLILPSLWFEGFPMVVLESYSTGTPVIASRLGALPDIIQDNRNGLIFNAGDPGDLFQKVSLLLNDPKFARQLGANARLTYLKHYTPEKNYDMLMKIYREVIKPAGAIQTSESGMNSKLTSIPLISIGIPTYNGSKRIHRALNSIWAQQYPNLEVIVSDNCSTDSTQEVIMQARNEHPEIRYFSQKDNIGLVPNFEFVLKKATGKYFMWLGDDDEIEPGTLIRSVKFLEDNTDYVLASGAIQYWKGNNRMFAENGFTFEQKSRSIRSVLFYSRVIYGGMFHGLMRRSVAAEIPCRNVFGNDYHFVSTLAFMGKIKNFSWIGYNKWFGGTSRDSRAYAKAIGESNFTGNYPHLKMAYDAFMEVYSRSPSYRVLKAFPKMLTATGCSLGILYCYYITIFPFKIGGIIKRSLGIQYPFHARLRV